MRRVRAFLSLLSVLPLYGCHADLAEVTLGLDTMTQDVEYAEAETWVRDWERLPESAEKWQLLYDFLGSHDLGKVRAPSWDGLEGAVASSMERSTTKAGRHILRLVSSSNVLHRENGYRIWGALKEPGEARGLLICGLFDESREVRNVCDSIAAYRRDVGKWVELAHRVGQHGEESMRVDEILSHYSPFAVMRHSRLGAVRKGAYMMCGVNGDSAKSPPVVAWVKRCPPGGSNEGLRIVEMAWLLWTTDERGEAVLWWCPRAGAEEMTPLGSGEGAASEAMKKIASLPRGSALTVGSADPFSDVCVSAINARYLEAMPISADRLRDVCTAGGIACTVSPTASLNDPRNTVLTGGRE